jgi:chromosome segregation ATPase
MKELWKLKEEELNVQKELLEEEIFKLKIQIEKSENQLDNTVQEQFNQKQLDAALENLKISNHEVAFSRMELEDKSSEINLLQDQLKVTQENMAKLELELVSEKQQNQMLGDWVEMYEADETNQEQEVRKLKSELLDSQAKFCLEKDELKRELTSKLEDCDSRNKELENKLSQYKLKEEELHASQQKFFEDEIESLMEEHGQRIDMLMIELEKANNMIDYLKTEICSRDDKISNMKKYTDDVKTSLKELMVEYNTALNEVNNLKLRVGELENEVTRQNGVITDMAEEKKEAIRQLCSSLEHSKSKLEYYKSGYNELLQTLYG